MQIHGGELEKRLDIDAMDEAFRMADVAHARSVQSAIAASSARGASGEAALVELIRQAQDADQRIAATTDLLKATLSAPADQQDPKIIPSLRKDIEQLREARKTLRKEIERRFPQYAQLINPKPVSISEARARLHDGDSLIVTYFSGGRGHVWAIPKQGNPAFAAMALSESEIVALVDELTRALSANATMVSESPPSTWRQRTNTPPCSACGARHKQCKTHHRHARRCARTPAVLTSGYARDTQPEEAAVSYGSPATASAVLIRDVTVTQVPSLRPLRRCVPPPDPQSEALHRIWRSVVHRRQAAQAQQQQNVESQLDRIANRGAGGTKNGRHGQRGACAIAAAAGHS